MSRKNENLKTLGARIKKVRKALRFSQKNFAISLGMSGSYLSEIESGNANPGHDFFFKISTIYHVSLDYLFHGTGEIISAEKIKPAAAKTDFVDEVEGIDDLLWFLEHSPLFKNTIMGFAAKFHYDNEEIIKRNIEKQRSKSESKKEAGAGLPDNDSMLTAVFEKPGHKT